MTDSRNKTYDLIRAIAILFVICIHSMGWLNEYDGNSVLTIFARSFYNSIIHAGVPLFVMLSGALLLGKNEPMKVFFNKRFGRLFLPFLVWSFLVFGIRYAQDGGRNLIDGIVEFGRLTITSGVHTIYWYVYLIIGLYLITPCLRLMVAGTNRRMIIYSAILPFLFYYAIMLFPEFSIFKRFNCENLIFIGYYIAGYAIVQNTESIRPFWWVVLMVLLLSITISIVLLLSGNPTSLIPVTSLALFISFTCIKARNQDKKKITAAVWGGVKYLSSISYGVYLSHIIFISVLVRIPFLKINVPLWAEPLVLVTIVTILECLMMCIIRKVKLNKIFM